MRTKLKKIRPFLKQFFPENLVPQKKLSKKDKKFIFEKRKWIKKKKRDIQKVQTTLRKELLQLKLFTKSEHNYNRKKQKLKKKIRFLFTHSQIEKRLLKIENSSNRESPFLTKMKEKRRLSLFYGGIEKKFFKKVYTQAKKKGNIDAIDKGDIARNVLFLFERRLDVIIFRIGFAKTITSARQYISHNLIYVNGKSINVPTFQIQFGDYITLNSTLKEKLKKQIQQQINLFKLRQIYYKSSCQVNRIFFKNKNKYIKQYLYLLPYSTILQYVGKHLFKKTYFSFQKAKPLSLFHITQKSIIIKKKLNKLKKILLRKNKQLKKEFRYLTYRLPVKRRQKSFRYKLKLNLRKYERKRIPLNRLKKIEKNLRKSFLLRLNLKRLDFIPKVIKETYLRLNNLAGQNLLLEKTRQDHLKLAIEKVLTRPLLTKQAKKIRMIKSFHVETCFQKMEATVLYPTQKIIYPTVLNLELIARLSRLT